MEERLYLKIYYDLKSIMYDIFFQLFESVVNVDNECELIHSVDRKQKWWLVNIDNNKGSFFVKYIFVIYFINH